jgi:hypothetical protein
LGWYLSPQTSAAQADTNAPVAVDEVPSSLPLVGVDVNGQAVLKPLAVSPSGALSESAAIQAGRAIVNAQPFAATALEASVTVPDSLPPPSASPAESFNPIQDVSAWVVTFTSPSPVNVAVGAVPTTPAPASGVGQSGPEILVTHFSVVLDATTGQYVYGFFTK